MASLSDSDRRRVRLCRIVVYAGPIAAAAVTYSLIHAYGAYGRSWPVVGPKRSDGVFEWAVFALNAVAVTIIAFAGVF